MKLEFVCDVGIGIVCSEAHLLLSTLLDNLTKYIFSLYKSTVTKTWKKWDH